MAVLVVAVCIVVPFFARAQTIRGNISFHISPVLPSVSVPTFNPPSLTFKPFTVLSLSLFPAAVLPSITPSVAVKSFAVAVPNTPFAPALVHANAAPSVALPVKAAIIPALSVAVEGARSADGSTLSVLFDGTRPAPAAVDPSASAPALGSGLRVTDPADEPWLAEIVGTLMQSKTGRRILRDIATLEQKRGYPTMVMIKRIGNNGEFRYDSDLLVMDSGHRHRAPEQVAPIFAHELQHVLQRLWGLPADVLELEVESYAVESQVWTELGIEPEAGSFARMARRRLLKDADGFLTWLGNEYKANQRVHGRKMTAYISWLEEKRPANERQIARAEKDIVKARRVVESMRAEGKPEEFIRSFEQDDVEPIERRLRNAQIEKGWIDRDLALLSTEEGRARLRAYSRGVIRRARSLSRS